MSIKAMSKVWDNEDLTSAQKFVLLSIADHADEEGCCYPSVARLARRTSLTERGVRKILKALQDMGYLSVEMNAGKRGSNLYTVRATPEPRSPLNHVPPEPRSPLPLNHVPPTPEPRSAEPLRTISEPSVLPPISPKVKKAIREARDDEVAIALLSQICSDEAAEDFVAHRRELKKPLTERAAKAIVKKLQNHPDPSACLTDSVANGWQGVFPEKIKPRKERPSATDIANQVAASFGEMDFGEDTNSVVPFSKERPESRTGSGGFERLGENLERLLSGSD